MRFEKYDVIEQLLDDHAFGVPEQTAQWLARDKEGALVEIATVVALARERTKALERFVEVNAVNHASMLRVLDAFADLRIPTQIVVVTEHRPRIDFARVADAQFGNKVHRLTAERGLAVPLVCTLGAAVAAVLADVHALDIAHARVGPETIAVDAEGAFVLDAPRIARAYATPAEDVHDLVITMCSLVCATPIADFAPGFERRPPALILAASREDVPQELVDIVAAVTAYPPKLDAGGLSRALVGELPWAQWTPQQVLDELRALVPDDVS
jgi:hypothetical protein